MAPAVAASPASPAADGRATDWSTPMTASLVAACQGGEREAFDVLVERHRRSVYQVCYRFVGNHEDASDLAQDAFVRACRGLKPFKVQCGAQHLALSHCRERLSRTASAAKTPSIDGLDPAHGSKRRARAPTRRSAWAGAGRRCRRRSRSSRTSSGRPDPARLPRAAARSRSPRVLGSSVGAVKANFFHALRNLRRLLGPEARDDAPHARRTARTPSKACSWRRRARRIVDRCAACRAEVDGAACRARCGARRRRSRAVAALLGALLGACA